MKKVIIKGNWDIAQGRLQRAHSKLTKDDLGCLLGMEDEFFGRLERATGAPRDESARY